MFGTPPHPLRFRWRLGVGRPAPETTWRVYCALKGGASLTEACDLLGIARSTVEHHVRKLLREGALTRREKRPGHAARFSPGPRFDLWEAQNRPRGGRAAPGDDTAPEQNAHDGLFKVAVAPYGATTALPVEANRWPINGAVCTGWEHTTATGQVVRVRFIDGRLNSTLTIQPPSEYPSSPGEQEALERLWWAIAERAVAELAEQYGFRRLGPIERARKPERAFNVPGMEPGIRAKSLDGEVWSDKTPWVGGTVETTSERIAVEVARTPEVRERQALFNRDTMARFALVNEGLEAGREHVTEVVRVMEREFERFAGFGLAREEDVAAIAHVVTGLLRSLDHRQARRPEHALADFSSSSDVT